MRILGKSKANRRWFVDRVLSLRPGQKIVDIGCGPGSILDLLPQGIQYVGVDISERYVSAARRKYGGRGTFICGSVDEWTKDSRTAEADVVMVVGVLHHADDDEARKILEFARAALRDGGRFIFYEPCYLIWQSRLSAYLMSKDRGQNVRFEQEWKDLIASVFPSMTTNIVTGMNRLFYVCIVGQCSK
jgi:SAM-dependent methyltransferase